VTILLDPTPQQGTDDTVLGRVRALVPDIVASSAEGEAAMAVPPRIVTALRGEVPPEQRTGGLPASGDCRLK